MESRVTQSMFAIPDPPRYHLRRAPLAQALAQVRYPLVASMETMPGIAPVQEHLRDVFPYMEQQRTQEVSLVLSPAGAASAGSASNVSWRLSDDDGRQAVIGAGMATLSVGDAYTSVDEFRELFARLLSALKDAARVPRCDRLGVRFLSVVEGAVGGETAWRGLFRDELTGWASSDVVPSGSLVTSSRNTQLISEPLGSFSAFPSNVQGIVSHGAIPKGTTIPGIPPVIVNQTSFFLDIDLFVTESQPFDEEDLLEQFSVLHAEIDGFFFWTLTEKGKEQFGIELRDD